MKFKQTIIWGIYIAGFVFISGFGIGIIIVEKRVLGGLAWIIGATCVFGIPMYKEIKNIKTSNQK